MSKSYRNYTFLTFSYMKSIKINCINVGYPDKVLTIPWTTEPIWMTAIPGENPGIFRGLIPKRNFLRMDRRDFFMMLIHAFYQYLGSYYLSSLAKIT